MFSTKVPLALPMVPLASLAADISVEGSMVANGTNGRTPNAAYGNHRTVLAANGTNCTSVNE